MTDEPGFYNPDRVPYQKRPQEWATDPAINDIVLCTAAQLMKTIVLNNIIAFFIKFAPTTILFVTPTLDDVKDWMRDKFMVMVRSSVALRAIIPDSDKRTAGQTVLVKHFPGGRLKGAGANSPTTLRGRTFRVIIQDDLDGFRDNVEGDPSAQADRRAASMSRALRIKCSTPTLKGSSRIWAALEQSTFEQLQVPCPVCQHPQVLVWEQMVFDAAAPELARYRCANEPCGALWDDRDRFNAVMEGARKEMWIARNPGAKARGIHMNGLYRLIGEKNSMSGFLEEWVRDYIAAKAKGEKQYQVWLNTFLALCYEPTGQTVEAEPLWRRRESYNPTEQLPEEVLVIVAFVDVQSNRLQCETRGFGLGQESWGLEYRTFAGDPTQKKVWNDLDIFLAEPYSHPIRGTLKIGQTFVDAGGSKKNEAYIFTDGKDSRGIYSSRGARDINAPSLSPLKKAGYNSVPFYFIGTQGIKDTLFSRLMLKEPGPGYLHWPKTNDFDKEYFKQLTAEKKTIQTKGANKGKEMWEAPEGARNEPWDINVGMIAAMEAANYTEAKLRSIARDNARRRAEMNLPPKPAPVVQNLDALKAPANMPPPITASELKEAANPKAPVLPADPGGPKDITSAENAPESAPVTPAPRKTPFKIWGKSSGMAGRSFGAPW